MSFSSLSQAKFAVAAFAAVSFIPVYSASVRAEDSLIYEARLNSADDLNLQNGAAIGAAGSGVSGSAMDKAYVGQAASLSPGANGPFALLTGDVKHIPENLDELTVTGWYKPASEMGPNTTLFSGFGTVLLWNGDKHNWTWRIDAKQIGEQKLYWFFSDSKTQWSTPGNWVFIAMTWKRNANLVEFYRGTPTEPAVFTNKMTRDAQVDPVSERATTKRSLGGSWNKPDRAFDGSIDNVRFYAKALDSATIEKIRLADSKNESAPVH